MYALGIRREDKNEWERRVPLTPEQVHQIVAHMDIPVIIQPSPIRAFPDEEYRAAGAKLQEDLSPCKVVIGVKEMPCALFRPNGSYVFFSHTMKGQSYNMPMLKVMLERGTQLIDYERITDDSGRRLVFFGRYAGLAGMIDSLWALGQRLDSEGIATPFRAIRPAHEYESLAAAQAALRQVAQKLQADGIDPRLRPFIVGFAGYGNVSQGAQEAFDLLPHVVMEPNALHALPINDSRFVHALGKVVFQEVHTVIPCDPQQPFQLKTFFSHPETYESIFAGYLPHLTMLINCVFWTPQSPRLITFEDLDRLYLQPTPPRLRVLGDISCDVQGALQCTLKSTDSGKPVYVFDVARREAVDGWHGPGPAIMAVDNLPCELPREASGAFGDALLPFIQALLQADYDLPFENLDLPPALKRAVIVYQGALTPSYEYLQSYL